MVQGSFDIVRHWTCLKDAHFKKIDTAFEVPGFDDQAWFFSGVNYIRASWTTSKAPLVVASGICHTDAFAASDDRGKIESTKLLEKPLHIVDKWPSLKEADFAAVDLTFPNGKNPKEMWVFSGDKYMLLSIDRMS
jgi:hypothetical protein